MHARFEKRIEEGLTKITTACAKRRHEVGPIERRVGRLLGQNTRAAGLFDVQIHADAGGAAQITWQKVEKWRAWAQLSEGSYVLRSVSVTIVVSLGNFSRRPPTARSG